MSIQFNPPQFSKPNHSFLQALGPKQANTLPTHSPSLVQGGDSVHFGHGKNTPDPQKIETSRQREFKGLTTKGIFKNTDITYAEWTNAGRPRSLKQYQVWVENGSIPVAENKKGGRR